MVNDRTKTAFLRVAVQGSGPMQSKAAIGTIKMGFVWGTPPVIWVDKLQSAAAIYSTKAKLIVVSDRVAKNFERNPTKVEYQKAFEVLILHEMLHWAIDIVGGVSEHGPVDSPKDPVYGFEREAFPDYRARNLTIEQMFT